MKRNAGILRGVSVVLLIIAAAAAQPQTGEAKSIRASAPSAAITFIEGGDLSVIRSGALLSVPDPIGFELIEGDQIQTGAHTQVELLLEPRNARVRLAENTVLTLGRLGPSGESRLSLLYGRLRAKVARLVSAAPDFSVLAGAVAAGVRGTDFGCDLIASQDGSPASSPVLVYCFEGAVAVGRISPSPSGARAPGQAPVIVTAGTMARFEPALGSAPSTIATLPIDQSIVRFWAANDFSALPPAPAAPSAGSSVLPADELARLKKINARKNTAIGGGIALATLGAFLEGAAAIVRPSNANLAANLSLGGFVCAAAGIPILVVAMSFDPFADSPGPSPER
ncbi:MAG: FecR domain-containing protein [Rectinemataceae bacterium]